MKKFETLLGYTQTQLKTYLSNYLCGSGYKIIVDDGFLFAKGNIPVLLVAHMDTAKKEIPKTIIKEPTIDGIRITADNTIVGGDDRCGVWMIMNIIKKVKCHVLFLEDEEIGCVGAKKFSKTEYNDYIKKNISFMIELDRRGSNDCVYYSNANRDFIEYIEDKTGTKEAYGTMSDISILMPSTQISGVNLSCGYYKEHTKDEYIKLEEMEDMTERLIDFLTTETEFPKYEYVEKKYKPLSSYDFGRFSGYNAYDDYDRWWQNSYYSQDRYSFNKPKTVSQKALKSLEGLILTVILKEEGGKYNGEEIESIGKTPDECWAKFFLRNPSISCNMIDTFYFE